MIALTPGQTSEHVLELEAGAPEADRTSFRIKVLSGAEFVQVMDLYDSGRKHECWLRAIQLGVVGWRNFKDAQGRDVPFPERQFDAVNFIPAWARHDLGSAVIATSKLTRDDQGKS